MGSVSRHTSFRVARSSATAAASAGRDRSRWSPRTALARRRSPSTSSPAPTPGSRAWRARRCAGPSHEGWDARRLRPAEWGRPRISAATLSPFPGESTGHPGYHVTSTQRRCSMSRPRRRSVTVMAASACLLLAVSAGPASAVGVSIVVGPVVDVSVCNGQNAEVDQAVDPSLGYVYESWMGCRGIAFARSLDGGRTFEAPISVPGSVGSNYNAWDPAVTVGPDGTVYAAFMLGHSSQWYPVVAASFDHGATFPLVTELVPPDEQNWGDRDFIAVGPDGTVYVTWDYGPSRKTVTFVCDPSGSCGFSTGQLNVVMQKSTDHGRT